ncbi:hypothetical protein E1301_Tti004156 [Triplophysa tibetana]|uniref:Apelin n=1 Tax=Triplophysa tibetana TaxID=1572043 RepID=A0A5A9NKA7_9TELE|nr:hypothetical protein E1301_Tti004156 [Triplophysa tibetana]
MIREQNCDKTLLPLLSEYNSVIELKVEQFSGVGGPMASTEHSKELEEMSSMRTPLRQNSARAGRNQRPSGWRRRRPRPRLSHKGPMPF